MIKKVKEQYVDLVLRYFENPGETMGTEISIFGRKCVTDNIYADDLVGMQETSLDHLVEKYTNMSREQINAKVSPLFIELFMSYGNACRKQVKGLQIMLNDLKSSEEKFHTISGMANDAIIMMDSFGKVTYWNPASERIFGYPQAEMIGKELHEIIVPETHRESFYNVFDYFKETGKGSAIGQTLELEGIRKGGNEFPLELSLSAVRIEKQWSAIGIIRDITARKKSEGELRQSQEKYKRLSEKLEESNNMKNLLLDIVTHDLKNPIGNILNAGQMLAEDISDNIMLDIIQDSCDTLLEVMKHTTSLAQVGMGDKIETSDLNLVNAIKEITQEFSSQLDQAGMKLELELPESLMVVANPIISEIPKNYISNAIKYATQGKRIIVEAEKSGNEISLLVRDFGQTIPENERKHVFTRQVQLEKGNRRGSGLGLAIVHRIAKAHNAVVGVEPNKPNGNVFYLKLFA